MGSLEEVERKFGKLPTGDKNCISGFKSSPTFVDNTIRVK